MLVLRRNINQEIVIDGNIRIKILEIKGSRIRIGISAPEDVPIIRREIAQDGCRHPCICPVAAERSTV